MTYTFIVEVETDETHVNAHTLAELVMAAHDALVGPTPEDYGLVRVKVANVEWPSKPLTSQEFRAMLDAPDSKFIGPWVPADDSRRKRS